MNVAGVVKDWLLIAFSWSVIKDSVTVVNLFGYVVAFVGVGYYNHAKLQSLKAKEEEKKGAQVGDEFGKLLEEGEDKDALINKMCFPKHVSKYLLDNRRKTVLNVALSGVESSFMAINELLVKSRGRSDPNQNTGIVIQSSRIGATSDLLPVQASFPTYLGRPWRNFSRTVVMQSEISDVINPAGWFPWDGDFALDTLYYGEYENTGAGADTSNRVTWSGYRVITNATEAQGFTVGNFIEGGSWLGNTGFPFSLGL
ncbi:hypothetical protein L1987_01417 [Smallanthus sonchifolius]|uniref:Uncharacterized protein n=1 Tax=Smallanthus sonchifolius TaxID=185202 RepID=A0ACB9K556_9ASTR|nr:hypothetical protein L1987_01417 [Smallanthus sonchifolius]